MIEIFKKVLLKNILVQKNFLISNFYNFIDYVIFYKNNKLN